MIGPEIAAIADTPDTESEVVRLLRRRRVGACRIRFDRGQWEIDMAYPGGIAFRRRRWYRKSPFAAYALAIQKTREYREHGALAASLSHAQRLVASESFRLLAPFTDANPMALLDVVRDFMKRHPMGENARTLDQVRTELIAQKSTLGRSERHLAGLDYKLRCLIKAIGNKVVSLVTTRDLEAELQRNPHWKPTTVHSTTQGWKILFNFAVKRGYATENPAEKLDLPTIIHEEPCVLTVPEIQRLLAATHFSDQDPRLPDCRPYLAIGVFAGLRPIQEMAHLDWRDVNLAARTIIVRAKTAKARVRRIVTIEPVLVEWLRPIARPHGKVLGRSVAQLRLAARKVLGVPKWPSDVLRHTYASYHFERYQNEALTKKQMGHRDDGRVFYNHYCRPVMPAAAKAFWSIRPPVAMLSA